MSIDSPADTEPGESHGALLDVKDLSVEFATEHGWVRVVDRVSFSIGLGEIVGLVGESGSGKTVTGLSIMRLVPEPPGRRAGGQVWLAGRDIASLPERDMRRMRGNDMAMIFQEPMRSLNPAFTVGDQISESLRLHRGLSRRSAMRRAAELLDRVGVAGASRRVRSYPHEFSGGMRQRVMIAMALSCEPRLLIADEPTTALDVTVQSQILELLLTLRAERDMAILLITHDLGVVAETCDHVVVMYAGQIMESSSVGDLYACPSHPYTEGLMMSLPRAGSQGERLLTIPGRVPDPSNLPPGCRFAPRCPYRQPVCDASPGPELMTRGSAMTRCKRVGEISLEGLA
jgi:oligopeptide/dipeptide ABC transporter ATP-binding protein